MEAKMAETENRVMDDEIDKLAVDAFSIFHGLNLHTDTVEEGKTNECIAVASLVRNIDKLCPHDLIGVAELVSLLVKRQEAVHGRKH
jgi:hypothetical protein